MIERSVWETDREPEVLVPVPQDVDVAIAGAGFTGLSAALALRAAGASVAVLERERVGFGASSRNGGMALTGLKLPAEVLVHRYGLQAARALFDASLRAIDVLEATIARYGIDCDFSRCGHVEVAAKPGHVAGLSASAEVLNAKFGHSVRTVGRRELSDEIGSGAFYGGLLDERSGGLDPGRYVRGLASAAARSGVAVCERAGVARIERSAGGWSLHTSRGDLRAKHLVAATGAYTDVPFAQLRRRMVPIGSYVIATERLDRDLTASLIPRGRMIYDSLRLLHYFRLTPDARMLFGGRAAFLPETKRTTARSVAILRRDMIAVFPQLADVAIDYAWGGTLDVAFDVMPHAGNIEGIYYGLGYAGHGVALATLFGTLVASAVIDGSPAHPFGRELPKAPLGLYDGRPWFLPLVGAWHRVLDKMA